MLDTTMNESTWSYNPPLRIVELAADQLSRQAKVFTNWMGWVHTDQPPQFIRWLASGEEEPDVGLRRLGTANPSDPAHMEGTGLA